MRAGFLEHCGRLWEASRKPTSQGDSCSGHRISSDEPWVAWSSCRTCTTYLERRVLAWACQWKESFWKFCVSIEVAEETGCYLTMTLKFNLSLYHQAMAKLKIESLFLLYLGTEMHLGSTARSKWERVGKAKADWSELGMQWLRTAFIIQRWVQSTFGPCEESHWKN